MDLRTRPRLINVDATLEALADPTHRGVVDLLGKRPRRAGELAEQLRLTRPAMSRHLRVLRTSGLIEPASDDADPRAKIYRLRPASASARRASPTTRFRALPRRRS